MVLELAFTHCSALTPAMQQGWEKKTKCPLLQRAAWQQARPLHRAIEWGAKGECLASMTASRITLNYRQIHDKQILHILCLTKLLTTRPPAFQEIAVGTHTVLSVLYHCSGKTWIFHNWSKQLRQRSIKVHTAGRCSERPKKRCFPDASAYSLLPWRERLKKTPHVCGCNTHSRWQ